MQHAARLDNIGLFVQTAIIYKPKLHETSEAPLHGAERHLHDIVDLGVGFVEADLAVVCRHRHGSQDVLA